jgi:hypothetical protein
MRGLGRLRRLGRRLRGRLGRPAPVPAADRLLAGALLPDLLREGAPDPRALRAAFRPVHDEPALTAIAAHPSADLGLLHLAGGILEGRQPFFDQTLVQPLLPDWRRVPGARHWPLLPAKAYDHADFTAHGDVRLLWELGRLQSLPLLAAAARLGVNPDAAEGYLRHAYALLRDFRERNPLDWGPHWVAGLESGLRIFSLLWTWQLTPPGSADADERCLLLTASLLENGRFTAAHLSEKAIANNHLLGEAAALYCLGCALPVFPESAAWRERGRSILERELPLQVLPDGVLGEQAIEYHRFVLEFLLQCLLWGEAAGEETASAWSDLLADMIRPLAALTGPDGELVSLGDDDGGRILRLDARRRRDARSLLALASRLLDRPDLGPLAGPLEGEALWLGGAELAETAPATGALPDRENFPAAGWFTARFGRAAGEAGLPGGHLLFKAGPMGRGGAGHGHADALSICLSLDGRPLLVDPGTYLYNGPQHWRDHFRGAAAHNLLRVGGRDPALPHPAPDRFGWERKCEARLVADRSDREGLPVDWLARREGDRDPGGRPLEVSRRVIMPGPGLVILVDRVEGADPDRLLPMELRWQLPPGLSTRESGLPPAACEIPGLSARGFVIGEEAGGKARLWALSFLPMGLEGSLSSGDLVGPAGWISPGYDELQRALNFGLAGEAAPPHLCVTILACPRESSLQGARLKSGKKEEILLEISWKEAEIKEIDLSCGDGPLPDATQEGRS